MEIAELYDMEGARALGGTIDYVVSTPLTKVFVLAEHPSSRCISISTRWVQVPSNPFFIPYHFVHFEVPFAIVRVALFRDNPAPPLGGPVHGRDAAGEPDLSEE